MVDGTGLVGAVLPICTSFPLLTIVSTVARGGDGERGVPGGEGRQGE